MTTAEALKTVEQYGTDWCYPGLLETLEAMEAAYQRDELYSAERKAFRIVWNDFVTMFAVAQ
jgi:hypothetical protein